MKILIHKTLFILLVSTSVFATEISDSEIIKDLDFFMAMEVLEDHPNLIEEESSKDTVKKEETIHES
jgi:hypothetical protein